MQTTTRIVFRIKRVTTTRIVFRIKWVNVKALCLCCCTICVAVAGDVEEPSIDVDQPSLEPDLQTVIGEVSLQAFADMDNEEAMSRASTGDNEPVLPEIPEISEDTDDEDSVPAVTSRRTAMAHVDSLVAFGLSRQNPRVVELMSQLKQELERLEKCSRQAGRHCRVLLCTGHHLVMLLHMLCILWW